MLSQLSYASINCWYLNNGVIISQQTNIVKHFFNIFLKNFYKSKPDAFTSGFFFNKDIFQLFFEIQKAIPK